MGAAETMIAAFKGFGILAGLTWFFSSRPRLFMRLFVPRNELFGAGRQILRRAKFRRGLRQMAGMQFSVACVHGLIGLWLRK